MQVRDLNAGTPEGYRALLGVNGSFAGVAPTTLIQTSGADFVVAAALSNLRASGHLTGGDLAEERAWDVVFGGRQCHIRDYF